MARTFEYVLHFVRCVTVTVSPNQIIIIIIIIKEKQTDYIEIFNWYQDIQLRQSLKKLWALYVK